MKAVILAAGKGSRLGKLTDNIPKPMIKLNNKPILEHNHGSNLTMNNYFGVLQAVLHDTGIGVLPDYVSDEVPELVRVLPDDQSKEIPVFLAFPEELRHSKRVQAFRDFVLEEIKTHRLHKSENV